jgi:hypothetical protein
MKTVIARHWKQLECSSSTLPIGRVPYTTWKQTNIQLQLYVLGGLTSPLLVTPISEAVEGGERGAGRNVVTLKGDESESRGGEMSCSSADFVIFLD